VGQDDFGRCLLGRLRSHGVDLRFVTEDPSGSTAVAFVNYFADGSRRFIFHINSTPAVEARFSPEAAQGSPAFFHVMGCSLMASDTFRAEIVRAAQAFHAAGARISFDPNIRPELLAGRDVREVVSPVLERCAVLLPGEAELQLLSGGADQDAALAQLFRNDTLEVVVLKRGRRGAAVVTREHSVEVPAYPVREVDPTGAGDCFDAAFVCSLLEGRPLADCARRAAAAGALNAAAFGPMEGRLSPEALDDLVNA
jgi:sugar/nucleoside kinase (ribokinase family)